LTIPIKKGFIYTPYRISYIEESPLVRVPSPADIATSLYARLRIVYKMYNAS